MGKFKFCNKPALVVSLFVAAIHAIWALAVALGVGQSYLDWIYPLHFVSSTYNVLTFNFVNALLLVGLSFVVSYAAVLLFMALWKAIKVK